jgi:hypothetical protein
MPARELLRLTEGIMAEQTAQHDRRYIGTKEVLAYSIFDSSRAMSIGGYKNSIHVGPCKN